MKFFNRKRYTDPASRYDDPFLDMEPEVPVHEIVPKSQAPQWDCAKVITSEEAAPGTLPVGWYVWVQDDTYYGLKPNDIGTGLIASPEFQELPDVRNWLDLPIPAAFEQAEKERREKAKKEAPKYTMAMLEEFEAQYKAQQKARQMPTQTPAQMPEKYDPMELIAEFEAQQEARRLQSMNQQDSVPVSPRVPSRRRTNEVHIRFSDEEYQQMQDRAAASCLPMSIFMRQAILTGEIKADPHRDLFIREVHILNTTLQGLRGECGRLGGLLKKAIKPNEEQKAMNPDEWEDLIHNIHALFGLQRLIERTMLKLNGRIDHELQ